MDFRPHAARFGNYSGVMLDKNNDYAAIAWKQQNRGMLIGCGGIRACAKRSDSSTSLATQSPSISE